MFLTTGVIWGIAGQGSKFGGFDLRAKFLKGVFDHGGSFGAFLEKFVILTPTSGVRPQ